MIRTSSFWQAFRICVVNKRFSVSFLLFSLRMFPITHTKRWKTISTLKFFIFLRKINPRHDSMKFFHSFGNNSSFHWEIYIEYGTVTDNVSLKSLEIFLKCSKIRNILKCSCNTFQNLKSVKNKKRNSIESYVYAIWDQCFGNFLLNPVVHQSSFC